MQNERKNSVEKVLEKAVKKQYPSINDVKLKTAVREMLFAPENRMIDVDNKRRLAAQDLRFVTANALEQPISETFNIKQAKNIEEINSGIDPVAEYFSWLSDTVLILKHLNDGFITKEDAVEREEFLALTDQREADLMVCLGLYEGCHSPEAAERVNFIRYKLQKLREMRTSIKFLTKGEHDVETTRSEYDAAIPYYKYFKNLQKLPFGYDMPYDQKVKLGISHEKDDDLTQEYNHHEKLLNDMLDDMRQKDEEYAKRKLEIEKKTEEQNSEQNEDLTRR